MIMTTCIIGIINNKYLQRVHTNKDRQMIKWQIDQYKITFTDIFTHTNKFLA